MESDTDYSTLVAKELVNVLLTHDGRDSLHKELTLNVGMSSLNLCGGFMSLF